jgi:hypothetical protein
MKAAEFLGHVPYFVGERWAYCIILFVCVSVPPNNFKSIDERYAGTGHLTFVLFSISHRQ